MMAKRAAAVQLTSDNYEEDGQNCDEVRETICNGASLCLVGFI